MACRIAHRMEWHRTATMAQEIYDKDFKVVYLCGEDDEGLELNLTAWHKHHGKGTTDRLFFRDGITKLMNEEDVDEEIKTIEEPGR